jgi:hypothetical protein
VANWDDQGKQYAAFIEAQLAVENDRRASVNTRAAATLTGCAGLVTVVLAVFAVFVGKDFVLWGPPRDYLADALIALLASALLAVLAGIPWTSSVPPLKLLHGFLDDPELSKEPWGWTDDEVDAREWTAKCNLTTLESLRWGTSLKFILLIFAGLAQVVAVCFLVACTLGVVDQKPAQTPKPAPTPCCPTACSPSGVTSAAETPPVTNGRG